MRKMMMAALVVAGLGCTERQLGDIGGMPAPKKAEAAKAPVAAEPAKAAEGQPAAAASADGPDSIALPKLEISTAQADIDKGKELFSSKGCMACHKVGGGRLVGPDLKDVLKRRTVAWTARMILRPDEMIAKDDVAKQMLKEFMTPMPNQGVDAEKELPQLMAYLKSVSQ